ncbi:GATA transcription factor 5-like [Andrographis paniculata]|uniref:GATA transcription factor 5-like n=1 Tax=Andrographis paniculata TaxID=175694 RepID=UPI0021E962E8|nr:GATA transcription factor 5-like [Andrographis paniculata]
MLYRTLHSPFLFTFNPFSHYPHLLSSSRSKGMEFLHETASFGDEGLWSSGAGAGGDDLFVDELLDFSNGDSELEEHLVTEQPPEEKIGASCGSPEKPPAGAEMKGFAGEDEFGSFHGSELKAEAEGLESLEWLSHFVEDSLPDYSLAGKLVPQSSEKMSDAAVPAPCFATPVQTKARTKRARTGVRVWPVLSPSSSTSSSISSASSTTTSFSPPNLLLVPAQPKPAKKQKKKPADGGGAAAQPRKCSHCGVTKTPQWRAGPMGSKTLCNACGVRYKSGRLLPEYRPACSPTFSTELHSNNHRKVLEMRRKKETETGGATGSPPVQSF